MTKKISVRKLYRSKKLHKQKVKNKITKKIREFEKADFYQWIATTINGEKA